MNIIDHKQPIGLFDSGIGGITVLKSLIEHFPHENFIYLGDTARLPYGSKSPEAIAKFSEQNLEFLYQKGVKAFVIACNSASSHFPFTEYKNRPVYNVISPGAQRAVESTRNQKVGILGTYATINSQSYKKRIEAQNPHIEVISQACPLFVPLAEEGLIDDEVTEIMGRRYLKNLIDGGVDTIVLGCTHYPILKPTLQRLAPPHIQWIESGEALSHWLAQEFQAKKLRANEVLSEKGKIEIYTTSFSENFKSLSLNLLAPVIPHSFSVTNF